MTTPHRPRVTLFAPDEVESIVSDALLVLEKVGVTVENEDGRALLADAGAEESGGRWLLSEKLLRDSLATAPRGFVVYDREGEPALDLSGDAVHFDPGSAAVHVIDGDAGRREATTEDAVQLARLVDGLPGYAAQSTALTPSDVPTEIGDRYRLYVALLFGSKPIVTGTFKKDGMAPMVAMLEAIRGGAEALADKPLAIFDCCPSPPLSWSDLTCQSLVDCARARVPAELVAMPLAGATAPVTLREAVVQHCAECLSGVAIHQLAQPGAPIVYGGAPAAFDMRKGTTPMGAMETMMIQAGYAQVGKHLGLPTHGYLGVSDAKRSDYQAGMETAAGAVIGALAGINVISGPGMLDYLLSQSLEKLLLDHEACTMALRLVRGVGRREGDLLGLFAELASAGELLSHPHTRAHFRGELSFPGPLVDRDSYGEWEARGALRADERARATVAKKLAGPSAPTLDEDRAAALREVMAAEGAKAGMGELPV